MKRGKHSKAKAQFHHTRQRMLERYGIEYTEDVKTNLIKLAQGKLDSDGVIRFANKQTNRVTDFVVTVNRQHIRFLYDKQRKNIVTVLPLGDYERFLQK